MLNSYCKNIFPQEAVKGCTEVIADDTDVTVMLLHHWRPGLFDIVFKSEISKKSWSIKESCNSLPPGMQKVLPFIHAFSGCDTTSAIFGFGKLTVWKKFKGCYILFEYFKLETFLGSPKLLEMASTFMEDSAVEKLPDIGDKLFVSLYGSKERDSLASLRYLQ